MHLHRDGIVFVAISVVFTRGNKQEMKKFLFSSSPKPMTLHESLKFSCFTFSTQRRVINCLDDDDDDDDNNDDNEDR